MIATAKLKYVGVSAQKTRLVIDQVRGKPVGDALSILRYTPKRVAKDPHKLMSSAVANAQQRVRLQVMSYHLRGHSGEEWRDFDDALRSAAARGVSVQLIVSNWEQREDRIGDLQALAQVENVEVRIATIPEHSSGFIPYARTIHAKYMTIDGSVGWIGTSNANGDYFLNSRNAGFVVEGVTFADALDRFFDSLWESDYVEPVDPEREYEAPRVRE